MNKSYRKGYNFQRRVKKYLEEKGFEVIVRPRSQFPDITAYKPTGVILEFHFNDKEEEIVLNSEAYVVIDVECKVNKYLTKKELAKAKERLNNHKCNVFFVAFRKNRQINFQLIGMYSVKNENTPEYIR